jgi:hypothetical protein
VANLNSKNRLQKPFVQNSRIMFSPGLGGKIRKMCIVLTGSINISGGTTNGTAIGDGGPLNLIQRIIVHANPAGGSRYPGGKIVDIDPRSLIRYALTQRNGKVIGEQSGSTLNSGAAGNNTIYLSIPIYFQDFVQKASMATALNTDAGTYEALQVEIVTADKTACFSGTDRAWDTSGLMVQYRDDRAYTDGDTLVLYQESHPLFIANTNKRLLDEAMPRDGNFLSWQILAEASASKTLADTLLNRVDTEGPTLVFDNYAQDIRQIMLDDEWIDGSQTAAGLYFIDFTDGAIGANTVDASTLSTFFDVNNVSGANLDDLLVSTRRVIAPTPASK